MLQLNCQNFQQRTPHVHSGTLRCSLSADLYGKAKVFQSLQDAVEDCRAVLEVVFEAAEEVKVSPALHLQSKIAIPAFSKAEIS